VVLKDDVQNSSDVANELVAAHGGSLRLTFAHALKGFAADLPAVAVDALSHDPRVERIEQDAVVNVVSDGGVQSPVPSWGLDRVDQGTLPLNSAYDYANRGQGVNVYIIDTGIRSTHFDFGGRAVGAFTAIDDGYGTSDCNGHGTHVAGIVGGSTYGVAKSVNLYSVRVLDCSGSGVMSQLIAALDWVAQNRVLPAVVNLSVGGDSLDAVNQAVAGTVAAGVTVVAAAGNRAADACLMSPASAPSAITVGSTGSDDSQASSSNWGTCVDLYGPGVNIISDYVTTDSARALMSGTSMAAPHVAGAAALYLSGHPGATPDSVAANLVANASRGLIKNAGPGSPNLLLYTGMIGSGVISPPPTIDNPPVANFTVSCSKKGCSFDAGGSADDYGVVSYGWNFGDGFSVSMTTPTATHSYATAGAYNVILTVTDAAGQTGSVTHTARAKRQ
jgi:subtilisin family serine protease